jgi:hypothetical protein
LRPVHVLAKQTFVIVELTEVVWPFKAVEDIITPCFRSGARLEL